MLKKVAQLLEAGLPAADIAVIAAYAAQIRWPREQTSQRERPSSAGNRHRRWLSRAREEAVIISLVRSNREGEIGFLADTRRMNVALTRARRKLIVIGDSSTLGGHPFYAALLEYFEAAGRISHGVGRNGLSPSQFLGHHRPRRTNAMSTANPAQGLRLKNTPGGIRTPNPRFRRPMRYPVAHRARVYVVRVFLTADRRTVMLMTPNLTPDSPNCQLYGPAYPKAAPRQGSEALPGVSFICTRLRALVQKNPREACIFRARRRLAGGAEQVPGAS